MKDAPATQYMKYLFLGKDGGACVFSFKASVLLSCFAISADDLFII